MINKKSNYLVILIATYNRLELLKMVIDSIERETRCSHEIIVIDGGSTDGTIEYLQNHPIITPIFQGALIGTSRAYNQVWRDIDCTYTCWLSDDTEVVNGSLDLAVSILEKESSIGMVGLKMKDVVGPWKDRPYMGAISMYGIMNCNHGVLSYNLLRSIGFFNESYRSYMIDPDLTASILSAGKSVVMTKENGVLHYREWSINEDFELKIKNEKGGINNDEIYKQKFKYLSPEIMKCKSLKKRVYVIHKIQRTYFHMNHKFFQLIDKYIIHRNNRISWFLRKIQKDWQVINQGWFINILDYYSNRNHPYYLTQKIPDHLLISKENPYHHLLNRN